MTTERNLCRPEDARAYFGPLMDLARRTGVPFLLLTHLCRDGQALGRRIVGACRVVWKMTHPDPEGQPDRRRLWVDKTYAAKPPALGMTIAAPAARSTSTRRPPPSPASRAGPRGPGQGRAVHPGRPGPRQNDRIGNELAAEWEKAGGSNKTFWRAAGELEATGGLTKGGGPGTRKQTVLHLIQSDPEVEYRSPLLRPDKTQNPLNTFGFCPDRETKSQNRTKVNSGFCPDRHGDQEQPEALLGIGFCPDAGDSPVGTPAMSNPWTMTKVGGQRLDWKTIRDSIDLAEVATRLLGPAPGRRGKRSRRLWWHCPLGTHKGRKPVVLRHTGQRLVEMLGLRGVG